jgi:DNA-binding transcriptional MocR family regulator
MAFSPPAPLAGAPLSRRLADTQSSPVRELLKIAMRPEIISLAGGLPAPQTFDVDGLGAAFAEVMGGPHARRALQYSSTEGDPQLRRHLAAFMSTRGLAVEADELLITTGSQQALGLIASALLDPGDVVLVEDPTYLAALQAFQLADLRPWPVPCDEAGPLPDALVEVARATGAKVAYLIPTFQNPTGRTMPAARRAAVAAAAAEAGLWLVEDDPYSALRLEGDDVDLLAAYAPERTIVIQTLSKVLSPGLRIGYVRAPAALYGPLTVAKQAADLHTSTVAQMAAACWLEKNDLGEHIASLGAHYRPRRDALQNGLRECLPAGAWMTEPEGGLFIWVRLPDGFDAAEVLPRAIERGVAFVPGLYFYAGEPVVSTLRVSFATATPDELREGAARLGAACTG